MEAQTLLQEGSVFANAALALRDKLRRQWERTDPADSEQREYLYTKLKLLTEVLQELQAVYSDGRLAVEELATSEDDSGGTTGSSAHRGA